MGIANISSPPVRGPRGIHIIHNAHHHHQKSKSLNVGNPLVESLLSIRGEAEFSITELFSDQTWIDNLLPIVHGHPGSEVSEDGVTVRIYSPVVADLSSLIQNAVKVAKGLEGHAGRLSREAIPTDSTPRPETRTAQLGDNQEKVGIKIT